MARVRAHDPDDEGVPDLAGGVLPAGFSRHVVTVAPGGTHPYRADDWAGALVLVAGGAIELVAACGRTCRLERGGVLWLDGVPLRTLHNPGSEDAVLVAITRGRDSPQPP
jgi:glyoxylate utilization-related uncharacterized protein